MVILLVLWDFLQLCRGLRGLKFLLPRRFDRPISGASFFWNGAGTLLCRSAFPSPRLCLQDNLAGFKQRFEVGEDTRPAARHSLNELRLRAIHYMSDAQFH